MGTWIVEGADRENGEDVTIQVEAASEFEAKHIAAGRGVLISRLIQGAVVHSRPAKRKAYRGLAFAGSLVRVLGIVGYVAAAACFAVALAVWLRGVTTDDGERAVLAAAYGLYALFCGAFIHLAGEVGLAVRDIAQNSHH
jgi:cytochrome bd-type quinol oxidase subunit 2